MTDYWRRSDESDKIYSCNGVSNGCEGGIHTGDASCSTEYDGVLCGSCSTGIHSKIHNSISIYIYIIIWIALLLDMLWKGITHQAENVVSV